LTTRVTIIDTGVANTASVCAALDRCGARVALASDVGRIESASLLVLPGVGAFGAGMRRLETLGAEQPIRERIESGRPTLAICLGMQLLCASSEESPGVAGLGVVEGRVERFRGDVRVPQFGWNRIEADPGCSLLSSGHAYFANSYRLADAPSGWEAAHAMHAERFVAGMERGCVLACQFHPELSGGFGRGILERWLAMSREAASC